MVEKDIIRTFVRSVVIQVLSESQIPTATESGSSPAAYHAPWTSVEFAAHPSEQQFNLTDPISGTADLFDLIEAQRCIIEEKRSCDHCGMCRRLGF